MDPERFELWAASWRDRTFSISRSLRFPSPPFALLTEPAFGWTFASPETEEGLKQNSLAAVLSGPREIRTLDLLNAIETRSQLRYGPFFSFLLRESFDVSLMDLEGFEPSTSSVRLKRAPNCATGPYSIQISR